MILTTLILAGCLSASEPPPAPPEQLRPVNTEGRENLGFPPPRDPETILAEIDALPPLDRSRPETNDGWEAQRQYNLAIGRRRIMLVSELEESGYKAERLIPLVHEKLAALVPPVQESYRPFNQALAQYSEVRDIYDGEPIAAAAWLWELNFTLNTMSFSGLSVSDRDIERIAEAELLASRDPGSLDVGWVLWRALRRSPAETQSSWYDWMIEHLPDESVPRRNALAERAFGREIRLQGQTLDGACIDTADWRGHVILVDFWGTWCGPCVQMLPKIADLSTRYHERGLRTLGILVDHQGKAREFLKENDYPWPQIIDPEQDPDGPNWREHPIAKEYGVMLYPTMWLIDKDGVLHRAPRDAAKLEARIAELLALPDASGEASGD